MTDPVPPSAPRGLRVWLAAALSFKSVYWMAAWAVVLLAIALLLSFVVTAPPRKIVIAAGPEGSYFSETAGRYAQELEKQGLRVEILHTGGARENVRLIDDASRAVDLAFIHGGLTNAQASPDLLSLGSIGYEPVWVFYRAGLGRRDTLNGLKGLRIATGRPGSGNDILSRKFLGAVGIDAGNSRLLSLTDEAASAGLAAGTIDAAFFMDPPETAKIRRLLALRDVRVMDLAQAEALQRNFPFLHALGLPRGAVDLARVQPPEDLRLVATTTVVVARRQTHPALIYLLMSIIDAVHEPPTLLSRENEFPADKDVDVPLSPQAERYFKGGKPFLQRYLPFWLASLAERFLAVAIPLLALLVPLMNVLPRLYVWRIKTRITACYKSLIELERQVGVLPRDRLQREFERLLLTVDGYLDEKKVPLSYSNELYILKEHVALVRSKIGAGMAEAVFEGHAGRADPGR